ncbi:hypothetical protein [Chroococcidiopsis sp. TS-821]|uniref:hypothetical protein n=1 Tax=Chroococcidiopsis sp. TS-821 TaxID=1378066 RepID=UPI0011B02FDC|nr:hypothetical protein [Chroococcidiopsis sp. TS-821]
MDVVSLAIASQQKVQPHKHEIRVQQASNYSHFWVQRTVLQNRHPHIWKPRASIRLTDRVINRHDGFL